MYNIEFEDVQLRKIVDNIMCISSIIFVRLLGSVKIRMMITPNKQCETDFVKYNTGSITPKIMQNKIRRSPHISISSSYFVHTYYISHDESDQEYWLEQNIYTAYITEASYGIKFTLLDSYSFRFR